MTRALVFGAALALLIGFGHCGEPNKQILDRAQHYQADALKLLERLVNIDSGTGYADGLRASRRDRGRGIAQAWRRHRSSRRLRPAVGDNIVASLHGSGTGRILLMAHMDTVFSQGHRGGAAVPHRRRARLWAGRVRRQGRHRHSDLMR